jgi:hypothetical protein
MHMLAFGRSAPVPGWYLPGDGCPVRPVNSHTCQSVTTLHVKRQNNSNPLLLPAQWVQKTGTTISSKERYLSLDPDR